MLFITTLINKIRYYFSPVRLVDKQLNFQTREMLSKHVAPNSRWLDLGCGLQPYLSSFQDSKYVGIDVEISGRTNDLKKPDKFYDGKNIPFNDSEFDGILCTQVFEHVEDIDFLLGECNRVLKNNGHFIISVPFLYKEHEQPYDFRRFTSFGLVNFISKNGFEVITQNKILSSLECIGTILCVYLNNNVFNKNKFVILIGGIINIVVLTVSTFFSWILPDNQDLYCVLLCHSIKSQIDKV